MTLRLANVTFDCADAAAVARFWSAALDRPVDPDPSEYFASIGTSAEAGDAEGQPRWLFLKVPESKTAKNRVHVDLVCSGDREDEVTRLIGLGAKRVADKDEWGISWTVLTDPEGNEFCVASG